MTTGRVTKKCTQVKPYSKPPTFPADFGRPDHRQYAENWWILTDAHSKSLIWEGKAPTSYLAFSTSFASASIIFVFISINTFWRVCVPYISLLIESKRERRIENTEKAENSHPPVYRVYEKVVHQFPSIKTANWWKVVEVILLNLKRNLTGKTPFHQNIKNAACGWACEGLEMYRSTRWIDKLHRVSAVLNSHRSPEQTKINFPLVHDHRFYNRVSQTLMSAES